MLLMLAYDIFMTTLTILFTDVTLDNVLCCHSVFQILNLEA